MILPAIHFNGNCKDAIELYKRAFHATVIHIDSYDDAPKDSGLNEKGDMCGKIMHSVLSIYDSQINMSDSETPVVITDAIRFNVFMPSVERVTHAYETLSRNGDVLVPIGPQFFSPMYAAVQDPYGVCWQIMV